MAFVQKTKGKKGPIDKVHYKDPTTGRRRCKNFDRRKDADAFRESPKAKQATSSTKQTIDDIVANWLSVCEHVGRKGREPVARATLRYYKRQGKMITNANIDTDDGPIRFGSPSTPDMTCGRSSCHISRSTNRHVYAKRILMRIIGPSPVAGVCFRSARGSKLI